jgi:hypothetical protein
LRAQRRALLAVNPGPSLAELLFNMQNTPVIPPPLDEVSLDELSLVTGGDADPGGDIVGSTFQEPDQTFGRGEDSIGVWG